MNDLTHALLKELLDYNPETGIFTWLPRKNVHASWNTKYAGTVAGYLNDRGYVKIDIFGKTHSAHRLAWLYVTGVWPSRDIDHANADKSDNRFANLREATEAQNIANAVPRKSTKSGVKGVVWHERCRKWQAYIRVEGRRISLGYFHRLDDARHARNVAAVKFYGEFARETEATPQRPNATTTSPEDRVYATNTTGARGVKRWPKGNKRWRATIQKDRKIHHLGYFYTFEEAVAARKEAEIRLGFFS